MAALEVRAGLRRWCGVFRGEVQLPGRHTDREPIALLAGSERWRETIGEILARAGFPYEGVESAEELAELEVPPAAIILWLDDALASIAGVIDSLSKGFPETPIVVVCPSIERWEVRAALAAGAAGVATADELEDSLGPCLRAVKAGQICVPRGHWREIEPRALSAREKQVLSLVVMGYMNSEIAERLFLAESTVKSHLSSAFGKLGVRSRNEAAELITNQERGLGLGILGLETTTLASPSGLVR